MEQVLSKTMMDDEGEYYIVPVDREHDFDCLISTDIDDLSEEEQKQLDEWHTDKDLEEIEFYWPPKPQTEPEPKAIQTGTELIAAERQRQIEVERHIPEHDDLWSNFELADAASSYAMFASQLDGKRDRIRECPPPPWPFMKGWWKPSPDNSIDGRIRELVKAGALIAAEIDRLNRNK